MTTSLKYDIVCASARLEALSDTNRVAIACASAETLFPSYLTLFAETADQLRSTLDVLWQTGASTAPLDLEKFIEGLRELYPDEDDGYYFDAAVAQNAVGAVLFAASTALNATTANVRETTLQVYELAYFLAGGSYDLRDSSLVVQTALRSIDGSLQLVEEGRVHSIREHSEEAGRELKAIVVAARSALA